jgi:ABC-2 type transport system permease protein
MSTDLPLHETLAAPPATAPMPGRLRREFGVIAGLWRRDMLRFRRDTGRWVGLVLQPLLIWWLLGAGMRDSLALPGGGAGTSYAWYLPGAIAMIALFTSIFATMGVIEDRQHGFLQQVLVAPASRASMILGKALGVLSVALIQLALTIPAFALSGLDLGTVHWSLLLAVFVPGVLAMTALSFCLAWVVRTTHAYHALMGVLLIPLWLVSGALFPLPTDGFLRWVNTLNPIAYLVDGMRHAFAGGEASVHAFSPATAVLALCTGAVVGLALASLIARRPITGGPG